MQKIEINSNITAFYFGAEGEPEYHYADSPVDNDWVVGACYSLGVASYVIHSGDSCLVFDTLCSPEQANIIKSYLEKNLGITKFTVVLSHWHLHHIGGNELYKDYNIVATRKTRQYLQDLKCEIEAGTSSWGPPAIERVRLPNIVFDDNLSIFIGNLEVQLRSFNIHSDDSLCIYIPQFKMLLAGDMVEDTIPFISNPNDVCTHLQNYAKLSELDIAVILPNHCRLQALKKGGYSKGLIESSCYYLKKLSEAIKADCSPKVGPGVGPEGGQEVSPKVGPEECPELCADVLDLKTLMSAYLNTGQITFWPPYERIHKNNIQKMKARCNSC